MSQSSDQQLKQYEREILRAKSRVRVAELDTEIDKQIEILLGKLSKTQHKEYQAARLSAFIGANPELIITRRLILLDLFDQQTKRLTAPDVFTMEEIASLVVIMQTIHQWLQQFIDQGETAPTLHALVRKATEVAIAARNDFYAIYKRYPSVNDVPPAIMRVAQARGIKQIADRGGVLLPPSTEGES